MKENETKSYRLTALTLRQIDALTEATGHSKANVIATAIDRMYQQEIQTMTTEPELVYSIPTNEDHYTQTEDEHNLIPGLLDNQEKEIAAYMTEHFPDLPYEIQRVPETQSFNNRSKIYSERAEQALEALEYYVETHWYNWWPEATE